MHCTNCNKAINKGKWCSDKCRMAYKRTHQGEQQPEQTAPEQLKTNKPEQDLRSTLSATDKTFYDRAMADFGNPYYEFTQDIHKRTCYQCNKDYATSLRLNKYCSYNHLTTAAHPIH